MSSKIAALVLAQCYDVRIATEFAGTDAVLWRYQGPHKQLYGCVATDADMVKLVDPSTRTVASYAQPTRCPVVTSTTPRWQGAFNVSHYREQPHEYASTFHETVAPYTSVLVNGIYWDQRYPRLLTKAQLQDLHAG